MKIKQLTISCLAILLIGKICAQQVPTGTANTTITPWVPATSGSAWFRGGNNAGGGAGNNNLFGTALGFNSPIYTITDGALRMKLNGTFTGGTQYPILGYTAANGVNTSGYLLLGQDGATQGGNPSLFTSKGAFSLLHLNGVQNSFGGGFTQEFGYRPWMKTGITFTGNNDLMYFGVRATQPGQDQTEMVVAWSDNSGSAGPGPDDFAFRFIGLGAGTTINSSNLDDEGDLDGRHIARFAPTGEFGLGNTFGKGIPYVRPQSLFHMSIDLNKPIFMQITNQNGTGQTATDGLKVGYAPTTVTNREAQINQQENDRLTLYSNNGERIRIMQIGALNNGVAFNPGGLAGNLTRVALSHNPGQPITRPLSLLHLGYDVQGATNDGWRPWMDVGMFVSQESDNVFLGLKRETAGAPLGDSFDAVLSWGDNQINSGLPPGNGPDNFRIIFTSSTTPSAGGTPPATSLNGLEGLRMTPTTATGVFTGVGGDPTSPNLYGPLANSINPTNTLEVNSWGATNVAGGSSGLRFTNLNTTSPTITNPGQGVLAVDANGDVIYVPANTTTALGNICGGTPNLLINNWEIPLNNNNFIFSGQGVANNNVGIGTNCIPNAKLEVVQSSTNVGSTAVLVTNNDNQSIGGDFTANGPYAIKGLALQQSSVTLTTTGVYGEAIFNSSKANFGVEGFSSESSSGNYGGRFQAKSNINNPLFNYGIEAEGVNANNNYGGYFVAGSPLNPSAGNIGVYSTAFGGAANIAGYFEGMGSNGIGVYCKASVTGTPPTPPNSLALLADGDVYVSGTAYLANPAIVSDQQFKNNINTFDSAISIINQLNPVTFEYIINNHFNFSQGVHYGFIAQDVEQIVPELVSNAIAPAKYDSLGNTTTPSLNYKALDYNGIIPILTKAIQEQQSQIASKDSAINNLNDRLTALENCINALNLCGAPQAVNQNNNNSSTAITTIDLKDGQAIVLEQNVPNPFAEQTTINYFLPETVAKAQMLFYNAQGKLIQTVDLTQKGKGSINVFAQDLSTGIYTYTLVADGQIVETKKMIKQ